MALDTRSAFLRRLDRVAPAIARAFRDAMEDVQTSAQIRAIDRAIESALRTGNIEEGTRLIVDALDLGNGFFAPVDEALRDAYLAGAQYQGELVPQRIAPILSIRFDQRRPEAVAWLQENADRVVDKLKGEVSDVIRDTLIHSTENAVPYQTVRRKLVGEKVGETRKGGLIGLAPNQSAAALKAEDELRAGDFSAFKRRGRRPKSFDRVMANAKAEGRSLTEAEIQKAIRDYKDSLLRLRSQTISRTEGNRAMNAGRARLMQQSIDDGKVPAEAVKKVWRATIGKFTRDHHIRLHNTEVDWGQQFVSPETGAGLDHPHDPDAPAVDTVNCRCIMWIRVDWKYVARWTRERRAA